LLKTIYKKIIYLLKKKYGFLNKIKINNNKKKKNKSEISQINKLYFLFFSLKFFYFLFFQFYFIDLCIFSLSLDPTLSYFSFLAKSFSLS
jgi:hypothetical protein